MTREEFISMMGFSDNSPLRNEDSLNIQTGPNGIIDMSNTGMPLMANGRYLPPYSGHHQFDPNSIVTEIPVAQYGASLPKAQRGKSIDDQGYRKWLKDWLDARKKTGRFEDQLNEDDLAKYKNNINSVQQITRDQHEQMFPGIVDNSGGLSYLSSPAGGYTLDLDELGNDNPKQHHYFAEPTYLQMFTNMFDGLDSEGSTKIHELTHAMTRSEGSGPFRKMYPNKNWKDYKDLPIQQTIKNIPIGFDEWYDDPTIFDSYEGDPEEILAQLMQYRYNFNVDPNRIFTEDDIKEVMENVEKQGPAGLFGLDIFQPKEIIRLLNEVVSVEDDLPEGTMRAKYGGSLPKAQDGFNFNKSNSYGQGPNFFEKEPMTWTNQEIMDVALDAGAVFHPGFDFTHAFTKFREGEYLDAALYATFGILPFSAKPLVHGTKKAINFFKKIDLKPVKNLVENAKQADILDYNITKRTVNDSRTGNKDVTFPMYGRDPNGVKGDILRKAAKNNERIISGSDYNTVFGQQYHYSGIDDLKISNIETDPIKLEKLLKKAKENRAPDNYYSKKRGRAENSGFEYKPFFFGASGSSHRGYGNNAYSYNFKSDAKIYNAWDNEITRISPKEFETLKNAGFDAVTSKSRGLHLDEMIIINKNALKGFKGVDKKSIEYANLVNRSPHYVNRKFEEISIPKNVNHPDFKTKHWEDIANTTRKSYLDKYGTYTTLPMDKYVSGGELPKAQEGGEETEQGYTDELLKYVDTSPENEMVYDDVHNTLLNYLQTDTYLERLRKQGYENPEETRDARLLGLNRTSVKEKRGMTNFHKMMNSFPTCSEGYTSGQKSWNDLSEECKKEITKWRKDFHATGSYTDYNTGELEMDLNQIRSGRMHLGNVYAHELGHNIGGAYSNALYSEDADFDIRNDTRELNYADDYLLNSLNKKWQDAPWGNVWEGDRYETEFAWQGPIDGRRSKTIGEKEFHSGFYYPNEVNTVYDFDTIDMQKVWDEDTKSYILPENLYARGSTRNDSQISDKPYKGKINPRFKEYLELQTKIKLLKDKYPEGNWHNDKEIGKLLDESWKMGTSMDKEEIPGQTHIVPNRKTGAIHDIGSTESYADLTGLRYWATKTLDGWTPDQEMTPDLWKKLVSQYETDLENTPKQKNLMMERMIERYGKEGMNDEIDGDNIINIMNTIADESEGMPLGMAKYGKELPRFQKKGEYDWEIATEKSIYPDGEYNWYNPADNYRYLTNENETTPIPPPPPEDLESAKNKSEIPLSWDEYKIEKPKGTIEQFRRYIRNSKYKDWRMNKFSPYTNRTKKGWANKEYYRGLDEEGMGEVQEWLIEQGYDIKKDNGWGDQTYNALNNYLLDNKLLNKEITTDPLVTDDLLINQQYIESDGKPKAGSNKGALGLVQAMPGAWKDAIKKGILPENADRTNINHSLAFQRYYMNGLMNAEFVTDATSDNEKLARALSAYNWGRGNTPTFFKNINYVATNETIKDKEGKVIESGFRNKLDKDGNPILVPEGERRDPLDMDSWMTILDTDKESTRWTIPKETVDYINLIMDPDKYIEMYGKKQYESRIKSTKKFDDYKEKAKKFYSYKEGGSVNRTKQLIRTYKSGGELSGLAIKHLEEIGIIPQYKEGGITHNINDEEVLLGIAKEYNTTEKDINKYNNLIDTESLYKGQVINIPEPIVRTPLEIKKEAHKLGDYGIFKNMPLDTQIKLYSSYVNGDYMMFSENLGKKLYDKLNRVYYDKARVLNMSILDYMKSILS